MDWIGCTLYMGLWVKGTASLWSKMGWWENMMLHRQMKFNAVIITWARDQLISTVFPMPPMLFQRALAMGKGGSLGVCSGEQIITTLAVLPPVRNTPKPELPLVQQGTEDPPLCSGFLPTCLIIIANSKCGALGRFIAYWQKFLLVFPSKLKCFGSSQDVCF